MTLRLSTDERDRRACARWFLALAALVVVMTSSGEAFAQYYGQAVRGEGQPTPNVRPEILDQVGVDERVNAELPLDARVTTHDGRSIRFGELFNHGRPVILQFAYYTCPSLCTMVVKGLTSSLRELGWTAGEQFDVVTISVDPRDTVSTASSKRAEALREYGRADARNAWTFLVADEDNIERIASAAGFKYAWDASQGQYAHTAALVFASPAGRVSRYLYGLEFDATNLRLALLDATQGKAISTFDPILRYCYTFNGSKYVLVAMQVMKLGGALTLLAVATMLGFFWKREWSRGGRGGGFGAGPSSLADGKV